VVAQFRVDGAAAQPAPSRPAMARPATSPERPALAARREPMLAAPGGEEDWKEF